MSDVKTTVQLVRDIMKGERVNAFLVLLSAQSSAPVGKMFRIEAAETVIGRGDECELQIEDDGISRKHAKIVRNAVNGFELVDLGSTNGTFLNGGRVTVAALSDGDRIQVGSHTAFKFSLQDELEEHYQRNLYESATRDGLTRAFNRKYFVDALRKEFLYSLRHRVPLSVVMLDVDHFKKVNDTYGHPAGDAVLTHLAQRLAETIRGEDLLARYGGEEFVLLLRETSLEQAFTCAERCRRAVEKADFTFQGTPIRITVSLGVSTLLDSDFNKPEELVEAADRYLYQAKRNGRNRVEGKRAATPP